MTSRQFRAIDDLWSEYGLTADKQVFDFSTLFGNDAPVILEIGFGMGQSLLAMAIENPNDNFVGIEVHRPGVGALLADAKNAQLKNLKVICGDAVSVLNQNVKDESLSRIQIFFPDPWHKKKHHKRRLIQPEFVKMLCQKIKPEGIVHLATDWQSYAEHMLEVLNAEPQLQNLMEQGGYMTERRDRPETKFERRGLRLGHEVWDLAYRKR